MRKKIGIEIEVSECGKRCADDCLGLYHTGDDARCCLYGHKMLYTGCSLVHCNLTPLGLCGSDYERHPECIAAEKKLLYYMQECSSADCGDSITGIM